MTRNSTISEPARHTRIGISTYSAGLFSSWRISVGAPGSAIEIGFNSRYLLDVADEIDGDGLQMVLADAVAPTLVRDMADAMALYVLMPMRV